MKPTDIMQEFSVAWSTARNNDLAGKIPSTFATDVHLTTAGRNLQLNAAMDLPTLTKAELAELLFDKIGLNKRESKDMVEAFFTEVSDALMRGESVKLTGFGNFQLRDKAARPGRNPKTGVATTIPARRVVTFRPGLKLKSTTE